MKRDCVVACRRSAGLAHVLDADASRAARRRESPSGRAPRCCSRAPPISSAGKPFVDGLDLLQADHIRRGLAQPGEQAVDARLDAVDVPGGDPHAGPSLTFLSSSRDDGCPVALPRIGSQGEAGCDNSTGLCCDGRQIEKLVPQPQPATACGFLIWKDWPIRSSTKSISDPLIYSSDTESISTFAPSRREHHVLRRRLFLDQIVAVLEAGAAAALHADAERRAGRLGAENLGDPLRGAVGQRNIRLVHRNRPLLPCVP